MELPGRCGHWLDTDTVTVQGYKLRLDTTSKGWGLYLATSGDLLLATRGDFLMAMDRVPGAADSATIDEQLQDVLE